MSLREQIQEYLKEIEVDDLIRNIQIIGNEVIIDMLSHSPAMHEKKRMEHALNIAFKERFADEIKLKLNIITEVPEQKRENPLKKVKNIIAIASGKGGVGKSTVTANIAVSLAQMNFSVGILDADVYGPSIPSMFNVSKEKPYAVVVEGVNKMVPVQNYGVKILSLGFFAEPNQAVVWRGAMASKAIHQLIHDADWGELDFLIIDLPPGTGDIHLSIVQELSVSGAIIVSTPQHIALADVQKGIAMFQLPEVGVPIIGMIENMAYFTPKELPENKYYIFGKGGAKELADSLQLPFLGEIPLIQSIRETSDEGKPEVLNKGSEAANIYQNITKNMLDSLLERNKNLPPTEIVKITTKAGCSPK